MNYLQLAIAFAIVSLIAGFFGFGRLAGASATVAKALFFIFLVLAVISFFFGGSLA